MEPSEFEKWAREVVSGQDPRMAAETIRTLQAAGEGARKLADVFRQLSNLAVLRGRPRLARAFHHMHTEHIALAVVLERTSIA